MSGFVVSRLLPDRMERKLAAVLAVDSFAGAGRNGGFTVSVNGRSEKLCRFGLFSVASFLLVHLFLLAPAAAANEPVLPDGPRYQSVASPDLACAANYLRDKNIAQSKRSDYERALKTPPLVNQPDFGCLISAELAARMGKRAGTIIIDARNQNEFAGFHIPSSINIPLFAVKTKSNWKDKNILLISEGKSLSSLLQACADLKARGFRGVRVLAGGIYAWVAAGYPIQGTRKPGLDMRLMAAADVYGVRSIGSVYIFDLGANSGAYPGFPENRLIHVRNVRSAEKMMKEVAHRLRANGSAAMFIVAVHSQEDYVSVLNSVVPELASAFVFREEERDYEKYIDRQLAILSWKDVRAKIQKGCGI